MNTRLIKLGESKMEQRASRSLKTLYCLTLLAIAIPFGVMGAGSMVGMALGGGLLLGGPIIGLIIALGVLYRIYQVLRFPETLDAIIGSNWVFFFRKVAIVLMVVGFSTSFLLFFTKQLTLAFFGGAGDNGIGYFIVGIFLYMISSLSWLGVGLFEIVRLYGGKTNAQKKSERI